MIWEYICLVLLLLLILFWGYTKIMYPFWSHQPVIHSYDWMRRWIYSEPYIIQSKKPIPTKFNKKGYIISKPFDEINDKELDVVVDFIQTQDHDSENRYNLISKNMLQGYLAQIEHAHISLLYEEQYKLEVNSDPSSSYMTQWICDQIPLGVVCSYSLQIYMPQYNHVPFSNIHYWSFMCVHRERSKKNTLYELLQTHDYRLRLEKQGEISLYQSEGSLCAGVVPLVSYVSCLFPLGQIRRPPFPKEIICTKITKNNFHLLSDMLYNISRGNTSFPISLFCFPTLSNIQSRIEKELNFCYILTRKDVCLGFFVFRDTFIHIEEKGNVLECCLSYLNNYGKVQEEQFFGAFLLALFDIQKNVSKKFGLLKMNDLSHNAIILDKWKWKYEALAEEPGGFYLFNAGCGKMPFHGQQSFIWL